MEEFVFSAPGRTEIGGNHTDHQRGKVLASAVNLETVARVTLNGGDTIAVFSEGYHPVKISLSDLQPNAEEYGTTSALVRGVAAEFVKKGANISGFDAKISSTVLSGSGLSSSASFEVVIGTIINHLFFGAKATPVEIAQIGQIAENVYFGKPCGLMDQMACSVGGLVYIDFENPEKPIVEQVAFDFAECGYTLCIIDCGADHAALTDEYAAIPKEMSAVAGCFGKAVLREVDEQAFFADIARVRGEVGDRAVLRAIHFFEENHRVDAELSALKAKDIDAFLATVNSSGDSSWELLQNISPCGAKESQDMAVALALAKHILRGKGAVRVHGGGFAGTIQAFVPTEMLGTFKAQIEQTFGENGCCALSVRQEGGIRL